MNLHAKLVIEIQADLQVVLAGAQSSSQHHCSTVLLVLMNSTSDQYRSFVNQVLYDPILLVSTEIILANCSDGISFQLKGRLPATHSREIILCSY